MNWYKYSVNIKGGLFLIGILLVTSFVLFTQRIVNDLRDDNREIVKLYAGIIASVVDDGNDESLNFIFENIIQKVRFPLIQSDAEMNPISWKNLPDRSSETIDIKRYQMTMDKQNDPIPLQYTDPATSDQIIIGYLHFGDSVLIDRLKLLPYVQIGLVGLFILLGFIGFNVIRNSEKKHIWAGMAKETAHQLGTPVSALMGWLDILKNDPQYADNILNEIEADLIRLQDISNRFSNIGSNPKFKTVDLVDIIEGVITYLKKRLPEVELNFRCDSEDFNYKGNHELLSWAVENVIKNGIDATKNQKSTITIKLNKNIGPIEIDISDNGSGIPRRDWKNIFRPGFSTKKYGWGLGLSLTKRIIEDYHKGKIFIKRSEPNKGTTISINLL